jgi:hypothetical protein
LKFLGESDLKQYRLMKNFCHIVGDILSTVNDIFQPRPKVQQRVGPVIVAKLSMISSAGQSICILPSPNSAAQAHRRGLPADKIAVKYNFADPDPGPGAGTGGYAMCRLSAEKGVETLAMAQWQRRRGRPRQNGIYERVLGDRPGPELRS